MSVQGHFVGWSEGPVGPVKIKLGRGHGTSHTTYSNSFSEAVYIQINEECAKTSQELRMLSSVTINCQVTKIVMNSGSQLSEL